VFTSKANGSPFAAIELLSRLATVFKDYCGILNEDSLRQNFVLIYELLDETLVRHNKI
jgi:AP-4 complex subunit mu-1